MPVVPPDASEARKSTPFAISCACPALPSRTPVLATSFGSISALLPAGEENSFNACAEAVVPVRGQVVHLLSPTRILLEKERDALAGFQAMAQRRIDAWEPKADWEPVAL